MINTDEIKAFDDVSLSHIFKNVYINNNLTKSKITEIVQNLLQNMNSSNDAMMITPIIKDYLNTSITNDKVLLEIAKILERLHNNANDESNLNDAFDDFALTVEDLQKLDEKVVNNFDELTTKTAKKISKLKTDNAEL